MINRLKRLLGLLDASPASQRQREAMLDLLVWTMYVDNVLALPENDTLDELTEQMRWDSVTPVGQYLNQSYARIRGVLSDEDGANALLDDIHGRLAEPDMRRQAYDACIDLARADGEMADAEARFLDGVRTRFDLS